MESIYTKISNEIRKTKDGHKAYLYKCNDCGTELWLRELNAKNTSTCKHKSQNMKNKRLQNIYKGMMTRCNNKNSKDYRRYGNRNIKICKEWKLGADFEKWALENGYQDNLSIDRIDCNKDYSPENCRWIPIEENSRFKSTTNYIEVNNILHSGKEWSKILNKGVNFINRYKRNNGLKATIEYIKEKLE